VQQQQVAKVAEVLHERSDELAIRLARAITREVQLYPAAAPVPFDAVAESCEADCEMGRVSGEEQQEAQTVAL
jgi:hypothetical protein